MKFERESWRKLYVVESAQHRLLPVFTRGLRDYLLRLASDDGTLLVETENAERDLLRLLNAEPAERKAITAAYAQLLKIGYLTFESKRLWITKFAEAQAARSPGAARQAEYKRRERAKTGDGGASPPASPATSPSSSPDASPQASPQASPGDAPVTSQRDETRRDETTNPQPPAAAALAERAKKVLLNPFAGDFENPAGWPETIAVAEAWSFGMALRLRNDVTRDTDLKAILQAFADGYPLEELIEAGSKAQRDRERGEGYFATLNRPGPAAFTAPVLRRLLANDEVTGVRTRAGIDDTGGYGKAEEFLR
jgi:hypothetical protein